MTPQPMPILLAIETSQRHGCVAVRNKQGQIREQLLRPGQRHDDDLLPAIDRLMISQALTPRDLTAVGVSVGPGGFTGLRIAVTTAKMLAESLNVAVAAVPSACIAARATPCEATEMIVALASKGDTFWATRFSRESPAEPWLQIGDAGLVSSEDRSWQHVQVVLADQHFPAEARHRCEASRIPVLEPTFSASACLEIAQTMLASGRRMDPLEVEPIYPRQPEAVSLWETRAIDGQ